MNILKIICSKNNDILHELKKMAKLIKKAIRLIKNQMLIQRVFHEEKKII